MISRQLGLGKDKIVPFSTLLTCAFNSKFPSIFWIVTSNISIFLGSFFFGFLLILLAKTAKTYELSDLLSVSAQQITPSTFITLSEYITDPLLVVSITWFPESQIEVWCFLLHI